MTVCKPAAKLIALLSILALARLTVAAPAPRNADRLSARSFGDSNYFPIAVWLQDPKNAERYKPAGINLYVALWRGPTSNQLALLEQAGMSVICSQNAR